jgi:hypothetical protein
MTINMPLDRTVEYKSKSSNKLSNYKSKVILVFVGQITWIIHSFNPETENYTANSSKIHRIGVIFDRYVMIPS